MIIQTVVEIDIKVKAEVEVNYIRYKRHFQSLCLASLLTLFHTYFSLLLAFWQKWIFNSFDCTLAIECFKMYLQLI